MNLKKIWYNLKGGQKWLIILGFIIIYFIVFSLLVKPIKNYMFEHGSYCGSYSSVGGTLDINCDCVGIKVTRCVSPPPLFFYCENAHIKCFGEVTNKYVLFYDDKKELKKMPTNKTRTNCWDIPYEIAKDIPTCIFYFNQNKEMIN